MKIIFTFLAICLLSFLAFGQDETAKKFVELGEMVDGDLKNHVLQIREDEFHKNLKSKLYVINYGTPMLITKRMKQFDKAVDFLKMDRMRIEIASAIPNPFLMTEFWIVPEGAENPKPTIYAEKFEEVIATSDGDVRRVLEVFAEKLNEIRTSGYLVNYGTKQQKLRRNNQIKKAIANMSVEDLRIIIVDGGTSKILKTEFWIISPKSEE